MEKLAWHSEKRKLSELNPAEYNPRQWTEKETKDLTTSLEKFNLADPVIINKDNTIISGHFRYRILKSKNGNSEIDVRVPDRLLSKDEERELNIRLNKNLGEWNLDLLSNFSEDLLKDVGFESTELDKIFQLEPSEKDDIIPEIKKTNIKLGDLFQLGNHRLLCGDATKKENVEKLMVGEKADMIFTDPPYGVNYEGGSSNKKKRKDNYFDKFSEKEYQNLIKNAFLNSIDYIQNTASYYIWFGDEKIYSFIIGCREAGLKEKYCIIWRKLNPHYGALGRQYKIQHEPCLYAHKKNFAPKWYGDSKQGTIWEVEQSKKNDLHPTMKPVILSEWAIKNSSKRNDIILDIFGGSGSTMVASHKLGRRCYMCEIEPSYCDVIIRRMLKFDPKLSIIKNGKEYDKKLFNL